MNTSSHHEPLENGTREASDAGFTLVEILIAIVLVGILSAVVIIGISSLTSEGSKTACTASADAAKAGSIIYYASHNNTYPTTLTDMTMATAATATVAAVPPALVLPTNVSINTAVGTGTPPEPIGTQASSGTSWYLTMRTGSGGAGPTFVCT